MKITLNDGQKVDIRLAPPTGTQTFYLLSTERSGSSMFWEVAKDVLRAADRRFDEPFEDLFERGVSQDRVRPQDRRKILDRDGHVFGIIRDVTELADEDWFRARHKVILVRDPRDVLVSLFYSAQGSHRDSGGSVGHELGTIRAQAAKGLRSFVQSPVAAAIFWKYSLLCDLATVNSTLFFYEDVVFDKRRLVDDLARVLNVEISPAEAASIADRHNEFPADADPARNIRQVKPGGWRDHLDERATADVERLFGKVMLLLGYLPEQEMHHEMEEHGIHYLRKVGERLQNHQETMHRLALELHSKRRHELPPNN